MNDFDFDFDMEDIGIDVDCLLELSDICLTEEVENEKVFSAKRFKRPKFVRYEYA